MAKTMKTAEANVAGKKVAAAGTEAKANEAKVNKAEANEVNRMEVKRTGVKSSVKSPSPPFDPYMVLRHPLATEKCIRQIEFENKLSFAVNPASTKFEVKRAVEQLFKVRVSKVTVQNSIRGEKKAIVRLTPQYLASDVSADLGLI